MTGPVERSAPDRPEWARDPDVLESLFHAALKAGDTQGVDISLRAMVGVDPARAVRLHDELRDALVVAKFLGGH